MKFTAGFRFTPSENLLFVALETKFKKK